MPTRCIVPQEQSVRAPHLHGCSRASGCLGAWATRKTTLMNLDVVSVDADKNVILLRGSVPGPKGSIVVIREAVKAHG